MSYLLHIQERSAIAGFKQVAERYSLKEDGFKADDLFWLDFDWFYETIEIKGADSNVRAYMDDLFYQAGFASHFFLIADAADLFQDIRKVANQVYLMIGARKRQQELDSVVIDTGKHDIQLAIL